MKSNESLSESCRDIAVRARRASAELASVHRDLKDRWLLRSAEALLLQSDAILAANARDLEAATDLSPANRDRLRLTPERLQGMAEGLRQVAALPDPVGFVREGSVRPNGLEVRKVSVPLGVIFFLYESRPNVTADAARNASQSISRRVVAV